MSVTYTKLVFVILFISYAYFFQGAYSNPNTRLDLSLSLAYERSYHIDSYHRNTVDKTYFHDEHYYMEKAPGVSYLIYPLAKLYSMLIPQDRFNNSIQMAQSFLYLATVLFLGLFSAFAGVYFFKIGGMLGTHLSKRYCFIATCCCFLGSMSFPYSTMLFSHQFIANIIVFILYWTLILRKKETIKHKIYLGLLLGLLPLIEYPASVLSIIFGIYILIVTQNKRQTLYCLMSAVIPMLIMPLHNYLSFGNALTLGYGLLANSSFVGMEEGLFGIAAFNLTAMFQLLFGAYRGFFVYNFVLILPVFLLLFHCNDSLRWAVFSAVVSLVFINASYVYWQGGSSFGPRHLVPLIPLVGLGLFYIKAPLHKNIVYFGGVVSFVVNLVGTATVINFNEFILKPLHFVFYYFVHGVLATNPLHFYSYPSGNFAGAIVRSSWNVGMFLTGQENLYSLMPLATLYMLLFYILIKQKTCLITLK